MFDYERSAGQAFTKDSDNRLKSHKWTETGIQLFIPDIDKRKDLGKYECDVTIQGKHHPGIIEIEEIFGQ